MRQAPANRDPDPSLRLARRFAGSPSFRGICRLGEITKTAAREFRRALSHAPKHGVRGVSLAAKPVQRQGAAPEGTARGAGTVNKSLTMLAAIVSHAQREGLLDAVPGFVNPFGKDVKLRADKTADYGDYGREIFQPSDLASIFGTGVFTNSERLRAGGGEAAFWFPLISLLTGVRLEEIAGLRVRDLHQDEDTGAWVFDLNPEGGRSVKTASSIRKVPVHPELERIGLLRYHQSVAKEAELQSEAPGSHDSSLWSDVRSAEGRPQSAAWSKWFGRFLRAKAGITDPRKVFHSFRHTFKRMARDAGIPEEVHDAITGHAGGGGWQAMAGGCR